VILGSAAPVPWRVREAEKVLINSSITKTLAQQAAEAALKGAEPLEKNEYKVKLFKTITYRSICWAAGLDPLV
jgi:xanthine dehydrogenase YagS FAD-binding subunit